MLNCSLSAGSEGLCSLLLNCVTVNKKKYVVYFESRLQSMGTKGFLCWLVLSYVGYFDLCWFCQF